MILWREGFRSEADGRPDLNGWYAFGRTDAKGRAMGLKVHVYHNAVDGLWWVDVRPGRDGMVYGQQTRQSKCLTLHDALNEAQRRCRVYEGKFLDTDHLTL